VSKKKEATFTVRHMLCHVRHHAGAEYAIKNIMQKFLPEQGTSKIVNNLPQIDVYSVHIESN